MAEFRKKPVIINAWRVRELIYHSSHDWQALPTAIVEEYDQGHIIFMPDRISIRTLEGVMLGDLNDMIIQGVQGELYPCKPDIFDATYEKV